MKMNNKIIILCSAAAVAGFLLSAPVSQAGLFSKSEAAETKTAEKTADTPSSAAKFRTQNFLRLDANKDDKLSKDEYLKDQVDAFNSRDENKDGFLSADENDFPPGMAPEQRVQMRERMMEDEKRRKEMEAEMEKRRAEMDKKMEEERIKREAEQKVEAEKAAKEAAAKAAKDTDTPAAKTDPVKEDKPADAKAPDEEKAQEEEPTSE